MKETKRCDCDFCLKCREDGRLAFEESKKRNRTSPSLRASVWQDQGITPIRLNVTDFNKIVSGDI